VKLPGGDGIDDEMRRATTSKRVAVAACIVCRLDT
jgi:hypothetical protein